jgi:ABC-type multidrug transport system ATPase subunit
LENLEIFAAMSGVTLSQKKLMEQLEMVGLAERARSKVKTYSQGMKQRLGIATALVHDPRLIILDEPTNGLDPQGIADIRHLILHLSKDRGKTLFISSHLLGEMELVADSMLIIDKGRKVAEGNKDQLLNPGTIQVELVTDNNESSLHLIGQTEWGACLAGTKNGAIILELSRELVPGLNRALVQQGINVVSLRPRRSLEDFFLSLTSHS